MNKKRILVLALMLMAVSAKGAEKDEMLLPLAAVEQYLDVLTDQENTPSLYGKLQAVNDGYQYVAYRSAAAREEPWVDIFNSRAAWDSKGRNCVKRLIGKDTCPDSREDLFRKTQIDIFGSITGTVFSFGLKPFFGKMPWVVDFDGEAFRDSRNAAEARLDHDAFKSLVERYQSAWKDIVRFENKVKESIQEKDSQVSLELEGFTDGDGIDDDYFYDVVAVFPWRTKPLEADSLEGLVQKLESISDTLSSNSNFEDVSLNINCPGRRLRYLIKDGQCDVSAGWENQKVIATGSMRVNQWSLPGVPVLEYSISGDILEAEFRNGLLAIRNVADSSVTIRRIDFFNAGKIQSQLLEHNSVRPGRHLYYADSITNGNFIAALEEGEVVKNRHLDDEEQYGVRVLYSRSGGSATTYLTEKMTVKAMLKNNIQSLQDRGGVLENAELFQQGFVVLRNKSSQREVVKVLELIRQGQNQGGSE